jgi:hypothetical protein
MGQNTAPYTIRIANVYLHNIQFTQPPHYKMPSAIVTGATGMYRSHSINPILT